MNTCLSLRSAALSFLLAIVACSGADDGNLFDSQDEKPTSPLEPFAPAAGGLRRLMRSQYLGSIQVLFGEVARSTAEAASLPNDSSLKGYDAVGAAELTIPSSAIDRFESAAREIAAAVVTDGATREKAIPCEPTSVDDAACFTEIAAKVGRVAWRRSLSETELERLRDVALKAAEGYEKVTPGTGVDAGIRTLLTALLQSPYFLYIVELGEPDPDDPTMRRLTPLELASRMSLFLTHATPDAALLDAAEGGALDTDEGIREVAAKLLGKPEAKTALETFHSEIYRLRELAIMSKDPAIFPQFTDSLKVSMREETLRLLDEIVWKQDTDLRTLFDADHTFADFELAKLYGVNLPEGAGFQKLSLPAEQQRMGIFGHAGLLAILSHTNSTSPTRRGAFVQAQLLCSPVPPPPQDVVAQLPPDDGKPKTMKTKLQAHQELESCANCHKLMDPVGFALEHYDGIGAYRTKDQGLEIEPSGSVPMLGDFADVTELATLVKEDERSARCFVRHLYRSSMGHVETKGEQEPLAELDKRFVEGGYRMQGLMIELCASRGFRLVGPAK